MEYAQSLAIRGPFGPGLSPAAGEHAGGAGPGPAPGEGGLHGAAHEGGQEVDEKLVLAREKHLPAARVALPGGAAEELAIDAAGSVRLRGEDEEATQGDGAFPESNVGAAARHVGGDRDGAHGARVLDDHGFLLMADGIEQVEADAALAQPVGEGFAGGDAAGAHKHGPAGGVRGGDGRNHRVPFVRRPGEDLGPAGLETTGPVTRDRAERPAVNGPDLAGALPRRAGDAAHMGEEAEE